MMAAMDFRQSGAIQMRVNLGGRNGLMPEHGLYGTQVRPAGEKVGGK
jgi:hypothetical protein